MKFGPKLFLVLFGLILSLVVLTSVRAGGVLGSTYGEISSAAIQGASDVLQATILDRDSRSNLLLRPVVHDARIASRLEARHGEGEADPGEVKQDRNDYFGSWMDEYWVVDRARGAEQDLMLLVGRDGTVAYGRAGEKQVELGDEVIGHQQISALIAAIPEDKDSARMLWSGNRLRTRAPVVGGLEDGLYLAEAQRVMYHTPGTGSDEMAGIAIVATHRLDLQNVLATRADALFVDHGVVAQSTFGLHDAGVEQAKAIETAAMVWLEANLESDAGIVPVQLAGNDYYAMRFTPSADMARGPVSAGLFYSRKSEFETTSGARRQLAGFGALLALFAVGGAVLLSRGLSRPIAELSDAAMKVAGGDLKVTVRADRTDELGELARRFNAMVQGLREREFARDALGHYLSPEMAADLMKAEGKVSLQGSRRELTILFCDVAGFTTISEQLEPEALVSLLNHYLDQMVKVLIKHGAYVDKFEGDAIMAFWNAPRDTPDHALQACRSLLEMRAAAVALSAEWKAKGIPGFAVRYGLNSGPAIAGNIGATDKFNYTAIGDNVNLASRLEGTNKQYGTQLLISESTRDGAGERVEVRELDVVKVKGKARPVRIFELLALKGELTAERAQARDRFEAGLKLYRERRFAEAKAIFESAPDDGPSRTFAGRCNQFVERPPGPDWDGTYEMATK